MRTTAAPAFGPLAAVLLLALIVRSEGIRAAEVPRFRWRVRATSCDESARVESVYGLRKVLHQGAQWSQSSEFNTSDALHWEST
eukprot:SAG31_NODE_12693_length_924_cov_0.653333_1_plen_84_part_00